MKRSPFDIPSALECPKCEGTGHTARDAPFIKQDKDGRLYTVMQGSGCENCLGLCRVS